MYLQNLQVSQEMATMTRFIQQTNYKTDLEKERLSSCID